MVRAKKESPYMLVVSKILEKKKLRMKILTTYCIDRLNLKDLLFAITHVDYSARIQPLQKTNPKILRFNK